jgi:integrase
MSVRKDPRSPYYQFNFEYRRNRFFGSTKATTRREAEAVERAEREKAKLRVAQQQAARTSLRLDDIAGRYWEEIGQHHAGSANTWREIALIIQFLGKDKFVTDITGDDVARLVAWRRGHRVRGRALIRSLTVNNTTARLKAVFTRCKVWGVRFDHEPQWSDHWLDKPPERVRELVGDEADRIDAATRDDLAPFIAFAMASGMRLNECLLRWSEVDWDARKIRKPGKGGRPAGTSITDVVRAILWPLRGHHPEFVFTFVAQATRNGRIKGQRYPLTRAGVLRAWRSLRKQAGVNNLRFHDLRHDFATKLLRQTGNVRLVQKALNHADIKSTLKYAHVLDDEVAEALISACEVQRCGTRRAQQERTSWRVFTAVLSGTN